MLVANGQIAVDGPSGEVFKRLQGQAQADGAPAQPKQPCHQPLGARTT